MKKFLVVLFFSFILFNFSFGEEVKPIGKIIGTDVDLKMYDHSIAGSVKDFIIWGFYDEGAGVAELIMRKDQQTIRSNFKRQENGKLGGTIQHTVNDKTITTEIYFSKIDKEKNQLYFKVNGNDMVVNMKFEEFEGGHFKNPTLSTTQNDKEISFQMVGGEGCYGLVINFSFMLFGAYIH